MEHRLSQQTSNIKPIKGFENYRIIGPIRSFEVYGDGTMVHKTNHLNGVTDVVVEMPDGSTIESIEA